MIGRSALFAIAAMIGACGGAPPAPAATRPVRIADHETEPAPSGEVVAVGAPPAGPYADPPPIEPPASGDEE